MGNMIHFLDEEVKVIKDNSLGGVYESKPIIYHKYTFYPTKITNFFLNSINLQF